MGAVFYGGVSSTCMRFECIFFLAILHFFLRRLDWDRGNTLFMLSAKRKAEHSGMGGRT